MKTTLLRISAAAALLIGGAALVEAQDHCSGSLPWGSGSLLCGNYAWAGGFDSTGLGVAVSGGWDWGYATITSPWGTCYAESQNNNGTTVWDDSDLCKGVQQGTITYTIHPPH